MNRVIDETLGAESYPMPEQKVFVQQAAD